MTMPTSPPVHEALLTVYVTAAQQRQFPVPLDDHVALVDAVDACRNVMALAEASAPAARPLVGISVLVVRDGKLLLGRRQGSHGAGEYACPGGHLEHLESFQTCAEREVREETGLAIGTPRFLRVQNATQYAPKHYVDLAFVAEWVAGEPDVREPDKVDRWDWYPLDALPTPLFAMLPSAIAILRDGAGRACQDVP